MRRRKIRGPPPDCGFPGIGDGPRFTTLPQLEAECQGRAPSSPSDTLPSQTEPSEGVAEGPSRPKKSSVAAPLVPVRWRSSSPGPADGLPHLRHKYEQTDLVPADIGHNELLGGGGSDTIHAGPAGDVIWGDSHAEGNDTGSGRPPLRRGGRRLDLRESRHQLHLDRGGYRPRTTGLRPWRRLLQRLRAQDLRDAQALQQPSLPDGRLQRRDDRSLRHNRADLGKAKRPVWQRHVSGWFGFQSSLCNERAVGERETVRWSGSVPITRSPTVEVTPNQ